MVYDPDPYTRSAGPPRHSIESDSEDEGEFELGRPSTSSGSKTVVSFKRSASNAESNTLQGRHLLIALAPALTSGPGATSGVALAQALGPLASLPSVGTFELDGAESATQASIGVHDGINVLLLAPDSEGAQHPTTSLLARTIVDELKPTAIALLSTYWPASYIISPDLPTPPDSDEPPVRYLCSPGPNATALEHIARSHSQAYGHIQAVLPLDVPNALTGVDGALVLQANLRRIPISVILQPFDPVQGLRSLQTSTDAIFPLQAGTSTTSPIPALVQAALSLATPLAFSLGGSAPASTTSADAKTTAGDTAELAQTGSFLRSRRRRKVDEESSAQLINARMAVREGGPGRGAEAESSLYM
ncbi:hypothetical protein V8E36_002246 [Tilletia maclaganii]